ncbi:MAG TPA: toll/interleukin-1 receptor domain-containing protein [Chryseolinea sp.]|nr:toll/interleukin-1 receptor domain-containing protein [Chryseolinea sp.]
MSVFISYSSKDKDFVDKLGIRLVTDRIKVWVDRWEINVGDSLINKIQDALGESSFLLVVLSNSFVQSEWCKKELNSGLIREIESKRVIILPVVIDDCQIPVFLKEKKYADFRKNFESGYKELIVPLASLFSEYMGRDTDSESNTDFALDWGITSKGSYNFNVDSVVTFKNKPFCILSQTSFFGNAAATKRWIDQSKAGLGWMMKEVIVGMCANNKYIMDMHVMLRNDKPHVETITIGDPAAGVAFEMDIRVRILGMDTGKETLFGYPHIFHVLDSTKSERIKK